MSAANTQKSVEFWVKWSGLLGVTVI